MNDPAFGAWPTDGDPADSRRRLRVGESAPGECDLLREAEERVDAEPPRRRAPERRGPYLGGRQDRSTLADSALRGLRRGAR